MGSPYIIMLATGILAIMPLSVDAMPSLDNCPPPRPNSDLLSHLIKAGSELQGKHRHSGGSGIATLKQLTQTQSHIVGRLVDVIGFTFYVDRLQTVDLNTVKVPAEDLWCIARPGDTVLLSDEVTHHYTMIDSIDRTKNLIYFLDNWPDQFFLLPGRNVEDVSAEVAQDVNGKKLVRITKADFNRVAVGLSTLDNLGLFEYYLTVNPHAAKISTTYVQFAYAALESGKNVFVPQAIELLRKGLKIAEESDDDEVAEMVAYKLQFALQASFHGITGEERLNYLQGKLDELHQNYDEATLIAMFSEQDHHSLAATSVRRAKVYLAKKDYDRAIIDANSALKFIAVLAEARQRKSPDQTELTSADVDEEKHIGARAFLSLSENALLTRGIALWFQNPEHNCKVVPGIMGDGRFLIQVLPNSSSGYTLLGLCQAVLHENEARANLNRAIQLETDDGAIKNLNLVLSSLESEHTKKQETK